MKIHLHNFNNLKNLTYEIDNRKINFLFGISGSGKSSISKSLNVVDWSKYLTVGCPLGSCSVSLEDKEFDDGEVVPIYDYEYMSNILIQKNNKNDIYTIIFAGEDTLNEYRIRYNEYLGDLRSYKDQLVLVKSNIHTLVQALKISFNRDENYSSKCLIRRFENTITSKGRNTLAHKYAGDRAKWFADGANTEDYANGKCPFCSKKIAEKRKSIIESIISIDSKSFEKIVKETPVFNVLNIELPTWNSKKSTNKFRRRLHNIVDSEFEIDGLIKTIDAAYKTEFDVSSISKIKISNKIKELFPDLYGAVKSFNNSLKEIKELLGKIKNKTMSLISRNINCINDYLRRFSIPYVFEKTMVDYDNRVAEYIIRHENESSQTDRVDNLSFGERNIIGLILFVLTNKNKKMLVIDDPASSFDNYRRKIILDMIFETKQPNSTVLVLSHDEVFVKLALYFATDAKNKMVKKSSMSDVEKKYSSEIGKTTFIESNEASDLIEISINDFNSLDAFIKIRLGQLPRTINYQTAILLRLILENKNHKCKSEKVAYGYLSAIIHETPYPDIISSLASKGFSENDILNEITRLIGHKYSPLRFDYLNDYKTLNYNDLEYVVLFREFLKETKDKQKKAIKTELNSIVHLSSTYITCLNPFKYKMYSKQTHVFIEEEKNRWLNS